MQGQLNVKIWYTCLCHCRSDRSCNKCVHTHTQTCTAFLYMNSQIKKKKDKNIIISIPVKTEENLMNITFLTCKQNLQPVGISIHSNSNVCVNVFVRAYISFSLSQIYNVYSTRKLSDSIKCRQTIYIVN